jgi:GR25 family glycosyltransferase involved in LPS biosynthesis
MLIENKIPIFVINLDRSKDRWDLLQDDFKNLKRRINIF